MTSLTWHRRGIYFATIAPTADSTSVLIHNLSSCNSVSPFSKSPGMVVTLLFHPSQPLLFIATQRTVRIYNLMKQTLIRKLMPGCRWISSLAIHTSGDHLIVGTYDSKLHWFDLDLSSKPYKSLRYHKSSIRSVSFHPTLPLFASAGDDGNVCVFYGKIYEDLMMNPLIVPVKKLEAHDVVENLGVLDCMFHPVQPWIFTAGADGVIKLFVE